MKFKLIMLDGQEIEIELDANKVPVMDAATFEKVHKEMKKAHDDAAEHTKHLRDMKTMCDDLQEQNETLKAEKKEAKDSVEPLRAQVDSLKRDLAKVQKDAKPDPKTMQAAVLSRAKKLAVLSNLVDKGEIKDAADWTDRKLMEAVIVADSVDTDPKLELKDKSDEYIQATYDHIERRMVEKLNMDAVLGMMIVDGRQTEGQELGTLLDPRRSTTHRIKAKDGMEEEGADKTKDDMKDKMENRHKDYKASASRDDFAGKHKIDEKARDRGRGKK
jgi:hypothetical protein